MVADPMKAFTVVNDKVSEGIKFQRTPYPNIKVASRIPIHEELAQASGESIQRASVLRLSQGSLMLVPEAEPGTEPDDKRALIYLEITGFVETVSSSQYSIVACPKRGAKMDWTCELCGQKAATENQGLDYPIYIPRYVSVHPRYEGEVRQWKSLDVLDLVVYRRGLFSIGRILLFVLKPGEGVRTCKYGFFRLTEQFLAWDGEKFRTGSFE